MKNTMTILTRTRTTIAAAIAAAAMMVACNYAPDSSGNFNASSDGGTSRGGSMARFTISGDWLYTVNENQLSVVSITNPEKPVEGDRIGLGSGIETIFPMDTLLFIGSQTGMQIYNIKNPEFPQHLSTRLHFRSCDPVVAADTLAFVTLNSTLGTWCGTGGNLLQVYNIKNLKDPVLLSEVSMSSPRGLAVDLAGKLLFVCDDRIKAFDISDPYNPQPLYTSLSLEEVGRIEAYDCIVTAEGRLLIVGAAGLYQLGYDREKFSFISKIDIRRYQ